jgi:hypothetical protein
MRVGGRSSKITTSDSRAELVALATQLEAQAESEMSDEAFAPGLARFNALLEAGMDRRALVDLTFSRLSTGDSKTPFQTVRADFPHTAYGWSLLDVMRHYAASG